MKDNSLQALARDYLRKLRYMAQKHGLGGWVDETITENKAGRCAATEKEVRMLSRLCNDENIKRTDVPKFIGRSYRYCNDNNIFEQIRTNAINRAIYDKVSTLLLAGKLDKKNRKKK